jgi:hypothetical protein
VKENNKNRRINNLEIHFRLQNIFGKKKELKDYLEEWEQLFLEKYLVMLHILWLIIILDGKLFKYLKEKFKKTLYTIMQFYLLVQWLVFLDGYLFILLMY